MHHAPFALHAIGSVIGVHAYIKEKACVIMAIKAIINPNLYFIFISS